MKDIDIYIIYIYTPIIVSFQLKGHAYFSVLSCMLFYIKILFFGGIIFKQYIMVE